MLSAWDIYLERYNFYYNNFFMNIDNFRIATYGFKQNVMYYNEILMKTESPRLGDPSNDVQCDQTI